METSVIIWVPVTGATVFLLLIIIAVFSTVLVCMKHKTTSE